jgi:WD40 repeat protein
VITAPAQNTTVLRRDIVQQICDKPDPAADCALGNSITIIRGSIDGALIMEDPGKFTIQTAAGKVDIRKQGVARNADNTLNQTRTPPSCSADPDGACLIKLVLDTEHPSNRITGKLWAIGPDQLGIQLAPEIRVTVNKADIVEVVAGPRLAGVVTPATRDDGSKILNIAAVTGVFPGPGSGSSAIITVQNVQQLKPVAKVPQRAPAAIHQIIWPRAREIVVSLYPTTVWLYRPDLDATPRFRSFASPGGELTLSPDGRLMAKANMSPFTFKPTIELRDIESGELLHMIPGALIVQFSPDGQYLAGSEGKGLKFWNVNTQKIDKTIPDAALSPKMDILPPIRFSPDGKLVASTNAAGTIGLWDTSTGKLVTPVKEQDGTVRDVRFSPDGKFLAGELGKRIRLWNVATGDAVTVLEGHTDNIYDLCFSPDGTLLASVGKDSTLRLWDVATAKLLVTLTMDGTASIYSVVFSPDGSRLATTSTALWFWGVQ